MATIRDVAKKAGVSVGTVSHVLTGSGRVRLERRERVLQAIRELEYEPNSVARSLKTRQTKMLGAMVSDITNPIYPQLIRGAEDAALERDFVLITVNTDDRIDRERRFLSLLLARRVDGLLLVSSPDNGDESHLERALKSATPIVAVDRCPDGLPLDAVYLDNAKGARMCTNHLLRLGHRRIAYLGGNRTARNAKDRLRGYCQALGDARVRVETSLIADCDCRQQSGYLAAKEMCLRSDPPTAIFAGNGMTGIGAVQAIQELGIECPRQLSLAMFDDLPFAHLIQPRLTAVAQPAYEMGYRAAELLIGRIEGTITQPAPVHVQLEPELMVRASTGPPVRDLPAASAAGSNPG